MAQYAITIIVDDDERRVLLAAVDEYLEMCEREREAGNPAAFYGYANFLTRFPGTRKKLDRGRYVLGLGETEVDALEAAIERYLDGCDRKIAEDPPSTSLVSDRATAQQFLTRLCEKSMRASLEWSDYEAGL
jgi:hypothetical protein